MLMSMKRLAMPIASACRQTPFSSSPASFFSSTTKPSSSVLPSPPLPSRILFLGAPGSGKGTFSAVIHKHFGIPHISTGDMVRALIEKKTDLGLQMQPYIMAGELVPDELIFPLAMQRIVHSEETKRGQTFLLDGFPRNLEQAKQFEKLFMEAVPGGKIDLVLNLQLREDILVKKIVHRWNCPQCNAGYNFASIIEPENGINLPPLLPKHDKMCDNCPTVHLTQREDDTVAIVQSRLKAYHALTQPLLAHYREKHAKSPLTAAPVIDIDVSKGKGSVSPLLVQVVQSVFMR